MPGMTVVRTILADSIAHHRLVLPICCPKAWARALYTTDSRDTTRADDSNSSSTPPTPDAAAPFDNKPLQPELRAGLKLRMDTPYGADKAILTKILQRHGVAVRGGLGAAFALLEVLMEWKRMPAPPGDPTFKLEPHEEGHDITPEQYMADIEALMEQRRAEWMAKPEYQGLQKDETV